jgi:FkbM family methyltransferase
MVFRDQTIKVLREITRRYPLNTPRVSILRLLPQIPSDFGEFIGKRGVCYSGYYADGDFVSRNLFWFGDFEPWIGATLRRFAAPHSIAIDIGGNIGATAICMAQSVGPRGRVICFEPMQQNIVRLKDNIERNQLPWVEVEPFALSSNACELPMTFVPRDAGHSYVSPDGACRVSAITFDQWIAERSVREISVCKIDVEGHEGEVFAGMRQTLSKRLIAAFVFEHHDAGLDDPLFAMLKRFNYSIARISKGIRRVYFESIESGYSRGRRTADFLAVRQ